MTPHCSMRRPGAGGRSFTSPFEPRVRGQYGSLSRRQDLSHRVGRHTPSAVAAHPGHEETTSHELHTHAPKPAPSLRTRSTAAGAPTVMGGSRLHNTATIGPATHDCTPPGGEVARLPARVQ